MPDAAKIDDQKKRAEDYFTEAVIAEMSEEVYSIMIDELEKRFDIKAGDIQVDRNFVKVLNEAVVSMIELLQKSPKFSGRVSGFIKRLPAVSEAISKFQATENGIKVPTFEAAKKIVIDEVINQMLDNGLNQNFVQPLRDQIYQNVTSGISMKQVKKNIKEYIAGGKDVSGKLGRYIQQTAQQAVDAYSGAINKRLLETFDYDALLITGTIIDNSSPQCIFSIEDLNRQITRENWPRVKDKATKKFPLIEGTTFDNLPLNLLHWGCRHSFYPIKKSA